MSRNGVIACGNGGEVVGQLRPVVLAVAEAGKKGSFELSNRMTGGQEVVADLFGLDQHVFGARQFHGLEVVSVRVRASVVQI